MARLKANHISKKNSKMIVKENKGAEDEYGKKDNSLNDCFFFIDNPKTNDRIHLQWEVVKHYVSYFMLQKAKNKTSPLSNILLHSSRFNIPFI